jgi:hypothetical protein
MPIAGEQLLMPGAVLDRDDALEAVQPSSPSLWQAVPTEALGKRPGILRLAEPEDHEVENVSPKEVRKRRR